MEPLKVLVQAVAEAVATVAELAAGLVIALAVVEALWRTGLTVFTQSGGSDEAKQTLRLRLGRWLAVSLEFLLAADILKTAIAPSWQDIGQLGAIALIRTALNYFLQQEMDAHERQHGPVAGRETTKG